MVNSLQDGESLLSRIFTMIVSDGDGYGIIKTFLLGVSWLSVSNENKHFYVGGINAVLM